MALITDLFPLLMTDMERAVTILRNLSMLSAELAADATSLALQDGDGTAQGVFGANDVIIDQEDVLVGAGNAITRAQNGTSAAVHKTGAMVRLKGGTEVATFTFTGAETITGVWASGNAPAMYQLRCGASYGPMQYTGGLGQMVFLPFSGITPGAAEAITILAWTNQVSLNAWAWTNR